MKQNVNRKRKEQFEKKKKNILKRKFQFEKKIDPNLKEQFDPLLMLFSESISLIYLRV